LLSEYGNVDRFARNMELLLNDAVVWKRMSEDAISAVDKYHWSCISNAVMKVYKKVVEEKVE
jgi:glycosyltransferase involved in cell wall biosynthesis